MLFLAILAINLTGLEHGIFNTTKKYVADSNYIHGCFCHGKLPQAQTVVTILGPSVMGPGDSAIFSLVITSNDTAFHGGGTNIATHYGDLFVLAGDTNLRRGQGKDTVLFPGYELTHTHPVPEQNDTVLFSFTYKAPMLDGVYDTIFGNGNAVNLDGTNFDFDKWNYAENKVIHITTTSINNNNGIANEFRLEQNYPNPFNPSTNISFSIAKASNLSLSVYDLSGKEVAQLIDNKFYSNGNYSVNFEASQYNLNSGVYFYKLSTGDISVVKKMVLIK